MPEPDPDADVPVVDVMVVDGANVVGSRPDGWWRDRPGAAARLHRRLVATPGLAARVVLVLEGRARAGVPARRTEVPDPEGRSWVPDPEGGSWVVDTVHAAGEGDDRIVTEAAAAAAGGRVAVVTADRALAVRVVAVGAAVIGPARLLGRLAPDPGPATGPERRPNDDPDPRPGDRTSPQDRLD